MYKYFHLPEQQKIQIFKPVKRAYISPQWILRNALHKEVEYIQKETNESVTFFGNNTEYCDLKDENDNVYMYDSVSKHTYHNLFVWLDDAMDMLYLIRLFNELKSLKKDISRLNIYIYICCSLFDYYSYIMGKTHIRRFNQSIIKKYNFDVFKPSDMKSNQKIVFLNENVVRDLVSRFSKYSLDNSIRLGAIKVKLNNLKLQHAEYRNQFSSQDFKYF